MYSNYHAFHIIVQSLFHSQRNCNIEKAVLVSGANYTLESQRVFIWKWSVLSRIPSITLRVGLVGMFLNGFLYTRLWGRSKSSSVLKVLKQNFILSLCYSSGRTPYLKHVSFRKLFITSRDTFSVYRTRPLTQHYKSRIIFWRYFQGQEHLHFCFYFQRKIFFPVCAFSLDIYLVDFHHSHI